MTQTIDKAQALGPKKVPTEKLHIAALLAVACNTIMLGVCDDLKETDLYRHKRKQLVNELANDLSGFVAKMYKNISEKEEEEFIRLQRVVEDTCSLIITMTPAEIANFQALVLAYRNGEVYQTKTEKSLTGLINQKRVKPLTPIQH